jgi:microcystin-dependent protein
MSYNPEDKIQWEELSPSLQARFSKYDYLFDNLFLNSEQHQVVKVNVEKKQLFGDDNFRKLRVVSNNDELNSELQSTTIDMSDIFNNWYRYAHYNTEAVKALDYSNYNGDPGWTSGDAYIPEGQNIMTNNQYSDYINGGGWSYDSSTNEIHNVYDYMVVAGFISPSSDYYNYKLKVKVDTGWDDDNIMIIVGYFKDANGIEHTLSLVRGAGAVASAASDEDLIKTGRKFIGSGKLMDTRFTWGLIYDMGNATQDFLVNYTDKAGYFVSNRNTDTTIVMPVENEHSICYMTVIRNNNILTCKTTNFSYDGSDKTDQANLTFTYTLPSTKPASMSTEEYANLTAMLGSPSSIGFGARSTTGWFTILEQENIFGDNDIYALHEKQVYTYSNSKWQVKGDIENYLIKRIFLYSSKFNKLYFFKNRADWSIVAGGTSSVPSGLISMWSGSIATIPKGWVLCNGSNGTPDLRDKFIIGAGNKTPGQTGGEENVTLSESTMPWHEHGTGRAKIPNINNHFHYIGSIGGYHNSEHNMDTGAEGGLLIHHNLNWITKDVRLPDDSRCYGWGDSSDYYDVIGNKFNICTTLPLINGNSPTLDASVEIDGAGGSQPHNNMPPYYALCFIMKT